MKNQLIQVVAAVPELRVGDPVYNAEQIIKMIKEQPCSGLMVFPELSVSGYTCADLFQSDLLLRESEAAVVSIARATKDCNVTGCCGPPVCPEE